VAGVLLRPNDATDLSLVEPRRSATNRSPRDVAIEARCVQG